MSKDERGGNSSDGGGEGKVIHVFFGRGNTPPPPSVSAPVAAAAVALQSQDLAPVAKAFSASEVRRLFGFKPHHLRRLDRENIVSPSGAKGGRPAYTFSDLVALRIARDLLQNDVGFGKVSRAVFALKKTLPRVERPLAELNIRAEGGQVIVRHEDGAFEPISGQMVLTFEAQRARASDVVTPLRPTTPEARAKHAYELYLRASTLDESEGGFRDAEDLYRRAIDLDPQLAIAYTNLGNLRFRMGAESEAAELYKRALEIDPRQPEAHYNLGYVMLERGVPSRAIAHFQRALDADPNFGDAHFNLAMALEATGQPERATPHWRRYLELEPQGPWAEIAREHLKK